MSIFSIDQNSNSLWDVVPKLTSLAEGGRQVCHFVEDVDAAFAMPGAGVDDERLSLEREKFHHSGGADWGAALFYSEFLGRQAVDLRNLEPYLGQKISTLAKQLGRSVADLYRQYSPGDNWQLIGSSYVGDKQHHRVVGDLKVRETAPFVEEIFEKAREDMGRSFPDDDSRRRLDTWFEYEWEFVRNLLRRHSEGRLVDVYTDWLGRYCNQKLGVKKTSDLFATGKKCMPGAWLFEMFCKNYRTAAGLYNEALEETDSKLRPLDTSKGELPFFAVMERDGRMVRTSMHLDGGDIVIAGGRDGKFELNDDGQLSNKDIKNAGILCVVGKAIVLTIQVRMAPEGAPLALPYMGSLYMPASHALAGKLRRSGLLEGELHPVFRVRFRLPERLQEADCNIRLPQFLAEYLDTEIISAAELGENFDTIKEQAKARLESLRDEGERENWRRREFPQLYEKLDQLESEKRRQARKDPKSPKVRQIWQEMKDLQNRLAESVLRRIWLLHQVSTIDYWDSRGGLLPWCIGLAGKSFYEHVIRQAEIYQEGG